MRKSGRFQLMLRMHCKKSSWFLEPMLEAMPWIGRYRNTSLLQMRSKTQTHFNYLIQCWNSLTGTTEQLWDWGGGGGESMIEYWGGGQKHLFLLSLYNFKNIGGKRAPPPPPPPPSLLRGPWAITTTLILVTKNFFKSPSRIWHDTHRREKREQLVDVICILSLDLALDGGGLLEQRQHVSLYWNKKGCILLKSLSDKHLVLRDADCLYLPYAFCNTGVHDVVILCPAQEDPRSSPERVFPFLR